MYIIVINFEFVSDDIKHKIDQLQQEIEELKERKKQQDLEIANIENINLRERFINLSNNLLTEQLEKEQQVYYIFFFSQSNLIIRVSLKSNILFFINILIYCTYFD
ncbi:hypothetical protein ACI65C_000601 [Semiaphis heraclei]